MYADFVKGTAYSKIMDTQRSNIHQLKAHCRASFSQVYDKMPKLTFYWSDFQLQLLMVKKKRTEASRDLPRCGLDDVVYT